MYYQILLLSRSVCLFMALYAIQVIGQSDVNYVPPSPNAAALMKYVSVPVNLYTGTPNVNLPICNLQSRRLNVPITVSYHASGIKVQDLASSIGLGWSLNAGGAITRVVRGLPDEDPNGYLNNSYSETTNFINLIKIGNGTRDAEPDLFFFNFLGEVGKIVLDENGVPLAIPDVGLKIIPPDFSNINPSWEIVDLEGTKYVFGNTSESRENTSIKMNYQDLSEAKTFISTWYLTEIIEANRTDIIYFTYLEGVDNYYENFRQVKNDKYAQLYQDPAITPQFIPESVVDIIAEITIRSPKYLSRIDTELGYSLISSESDRTDLSAARRYIEIATYNLLGDLQKKVRFGNNNYFDAGCGDSCKRLKLMAIFDNTGDNPITLYRFDYNESENLPARNSINTDHWGYYNNNTYPNSLPPLMVNGTEWKPGANKDSYFPRSQANILTRINYPTGGYQEFIYEQNEFDDSGINKVTGGIRIKSIKEYDGKVETSKTFKYTFDGTAKSSGITYRNQNNQVLIVNKQNNGNGEVSVSYYQRFSNSQIDLLDLSGVNVGYSEVTIKYQDGSKEVQKFTNFNDRNDDPANVFYSTLVGSQNSELNSDGPPFIPRSSKSFERGLIKEKLIFDDNQILLKRIENIYDFNKISSRSVKGFRTMLLISDNNYLTYLSGEYKEQHHDVRLKETKIEDFDQNNPLQKLISRSVYSYATNYGALLKSQISYLNNGEKIITEYKYPTDYAIPSSGKSIMSVNALKEMQNRHMASRVIEKTNYVEKGEGKSLINSIVTQFRFEGENGSIILPASVWETKKPISNFGELSQIVQTTNDWGITGNGFQLHPSYHQVHSFDVYDQNSGNLLKETDKAGITTSYEWGYNNSLVTAVIINKGTLKAHRTEYTHKPLVGVLTTKDPNGRITYYEYDNFNRLKSIKDHEGNILKLFRYHYRE